MSRILYKYQSYAHDDESYENFDLHLLPGEVWLTTEPEKMTWLEAIEIAGQNSRLRLPHYADIIRAVEKCKEDPELYKQFAPLEAGEFWTIGSENYEANQAFACCVVATHDRYESHHKKTEKKWVRFVKRGAAETPEEVQRKKEEREKNQYEERLHKKVMNILELDKSLPPTDYDRLRAEEIARDEESRWREQARSSRAQAIRDGTWDQDH